MFAELDKIALTTAIPPDCEFMVDVKSPPLSANGGGDAVLGTRLRRFMVCYNLQTKPATVWSALRTKRLSSVRVTEAKMLEQYPISDMLSWMEGGDLTLNPNFQRRSVWPPAAKTYLIDTVLRGKPMPNIMIRAITDPVTRRTNREVVDGQQRLSAIRDFAGGRFALGRGAEEYAGMRYRDLGEEDLLNFLQYRIGVEQLFNADDEAVIDMFRRINSYSYSLNGQELRHAGYSGELRSAVVSASRKWSVLWRKYNVVGLRRQMRMDDDQLMAEMFGVVINGVTDGGQPRLNKLYKDYDLKLDDRVEYGVDRTLKRIVSKLSPVLETRMAPAPHFLMLFAAVAHATIGIPDGQIKDMPARSPLVLSDPRAACDNLAELADSLDMEPDDVPSHLRAFRNAASGGTTRIAGRTVRFKATYSALAPNDLNGG